MSQDNETPQIPAGLNLTPSAQELLEYRRRTIEIGTRSFVTERFTVPLPPELHGEWHGTDSFSQYNAKLRGFVDGSQFLRGTSTAQYLDQNANMGDVCFMVVEKWKQEMYEKGQQEISARKLGRKIDEEFEQEIKGIGAGKLSEAGTTVTRIVDGTEVNNALKGA